jgi:hypothetical protein
LAYLKSIKFEEQSDDSWDTFYAEFPHLDPEEDESDSDGEEPSDEEAAPEAAENSDDAASNVDP